MEERSASCGDAVATKQAVRSASTVRLPSAETPSKMLALSALCLATSPAAQLNRLSITAATTAEDADIRATHESIIASVSTTARMVIRTQGLPTSCPVVDASLVFAAPTLCWSAALFFLVALLFLSSSGFFERCHCGHRSEPRSGLFSLQSNLWWLHSLVPSAAQVGSARAP